MTTKRIHVRVLVIDDEEIVCRRIREWLTAALYDVFTFTGAVDALAHVQRLMRGREDHHNGADASDQLARPPRPIHYHLALVDLRLADSNGAEVIETLRTLSPATRILAMSAFPEAAQVIAAMRAGASDLLEKPVQEARLLQLVEHHLGELGVLARAEDEFNRRVGQRLRGFRQASERTLNEVAKTTGITPAQLSQIELGKTATSTWTLARLCAALRVPLERVFET